MKSGILKIAGFTTCKYFNDTKALLVSLSSVFPDKLKYEVKEFPTRDEYKNWLPSIQSILKTEHSTSPIVWLEGESKRFIGGASDTLSLCRNMLDLKESYLEDRSSSSTVGGVPNVLPFDPNHGFDYDLVVIGGGSGGLACSKEARKYVSKVAVLDYVKPSPIGSKWGLGGTCVNVGCIPKKLMHNAALLGEHIHDAKSYGWVGGDAPVHSWEALKDNVQDHIKGLNFQYRVSLRENEVNYINKLGKFVGPNTLECTDKNGKVETITAARFVIAVGGRPTTLECPGGEHAITSDDLFMKKTPPGKTCVIGAGYVALECGGFIHGLKQGSVTVLVRSMLLRGFDRETVDYVQKYMVHSGIDIKFGLLPTNIEKLSDGKLKVTYSNGESDIFDTVLCAIGRYADVAGLGIDSLGVKMNPKSGKIECVNEQTSIPHIYAIGDVVHGAPELTPVAIMAGRLLARRLFDNSNQLMVYKDIATAVFTPLEFGTVGLNEEEAIEKYGAGNIECYVSAFQPLEWSVVHKEVNCFSKVIVNKADNKVIGLQLATPNAGEIIQGFAAAFRKGLSYQDLLDTVGIHPTIAEEFTLMEISKSSGKSIEKSGC